MFIKISSSTLTTAGIVWCIQPIVLLSLSMQGLGLPAIPNPRQIENNQFDILILIKTRFSIYHYLYELTVATNDTGMLGYTLIYVPT